MYAQTSARNDNAAARRKELYALLGDLPDRNRKITAKTVSTEEKPGYILEKLSTSMAWSRCRPGSLNRRRFKGVSPLSCTITPTVAITNWARTSY
jgi:hypothetical protein